jgi:hypothetical protein
MLDHVQMRLRILDFTLRAIGELQKRECPDQTHRMVTLARLGRMACRKGKIKSRKVGQEAAERSQVMIQVTRLHNVNGAPDLCRPTAMMGIKSG